MMKPKGTFNIVQLGHIFALCASVLASSFSAQAHDVKGKTIIDYSYAGADLIAAQVGAGADAAGPVLIASLANIDKLESSSTFGRISADEIGSRLAQLHFLVLETRMRSTFVVRPNGEFMLSDQILLVAHEQNANSVLVGTYADAGSQALVSIKLIRIKDHVVIASADYAVPMDPGVHGALLGDETAAAGDSR